jgi:adenine deaminase
VQRLSVEKSVELVRVARGDQPADLLLTNAQIVNVFTGEIESGSVAIFGDRIVGIGDYQANQTIDLDGAFLSPGLIDAHMHVESSMVTPEAFAFGVVPKGTTSVFADPHEIVNVLGLPGFDYIFQASEGLPLNFFVTASSCVPATHLETAGASVSAADLAKLDHPRLAAIAEMMNFPGIVHGDPEFLARVFAGGSKRVDGHAPQLKGKHLNAYIAAGIASDHECTTFAEARDKLARGLYIFLREGSVTRDIEALLPLVTAKTLRRCLFCTDDREPVDLLRDGHVDFCLRKAVRLGLDPISAITMATLNAAEYFKVDFLGAIAPGYLADLVVFQDLKDFRATKVMKSGQWVAENGQPNWTCQRASDLLTRKTVHLPQLSADCLQVKPVGNNLHVIELIADQIVTGRAVEAAKIENDEVVADPSRDILKIAVIERHGKKGNLGLGWIRGFGLREGAIASTVAHDSHNIVVAGCNDADMLAAARALAEMDGGQVVVNRGEVLARLPLPVAGLMSDLPLESVKNLNKDLIVATQLLGGKLNNPFMALSFSALPVIPTLKMSDLGLVDVDLFQLVSPFVD